MIPTHLKVATFLNDKKSPPNRKLILALRCWQSRNDHSLTQRWAEWNGQGWNWLSETRLWGGLCYCYCYWYCYCYCIVIPSAPQKRDFGEGCDAGWEDCPKYVFNGTAGAQLGANFCCRVFILFQIINLNIFLIVQFTFFLILSSYFFLYFSSYLIIISYLISYSDRVTALTCWKPCQRRATSLTVSTMQIGEGTYAINTIIWFERIIEHLFSSHNAIIIISLKKTFNPTKIWFEMIT